MSFFYVFKMTVTIINERDCIECILRLFTREDISFLSDVIVQKLENNLNKNNLQNNKICDTVYAHMCMWCLHMWLKQLQVEKRLKFVFLSEGLGLNYSKTSTWEGSPVCL